MTPGLLLIIKHRILPVTQPANSGSSPGRRRGLLPDIVLDVPLQGVGPVGEGRVVGRPDVQLIEVLETRVETLQELLLIQIRNISPLLETRLALKTDHPPTRSVYR